MDGVHLQLTIVNEETETSLDLNPSLCPFSTYLLTCQFSLILSLFVPHERLNSCLTFFLGHEWKLSTTPKVIFVTVVTVRTRRANFLYFQSNRKGLSIKSWSFWISQFSHPSCIKQSLT